MLDKIIDFIYGKIPGFIAVPIVVPCLVIFFILLVLINIKRLHRPINEWE